MSLPLQGYGSAVNNRGRRVQPQIEGISSQLPNLTNQFAPVIRQKIVKNNHKTVQMLAQTMGTIFNPLIQNTTQANQQMAAQMTRITDFFSVPQPITPTQSEWVRKNQGVIL